MGNSESNALEYLIFRRRRGVEIWLNRPIDLRSIRTFQAWLVLVPLAGFQYTCLSAARLLLQHFIIFHKVSHFINAFFHRTEIATQRVLSFLLEERHLILWAGTRPGFQSTLGHSFRRNIVIQACFKTSDWVPLEPGSLNNYSKHSCDSQRRHTLRKCANR